MKTRKLTFCAILSALSVVLLYLGSILPTGRLALVAVAALLPAAAVVQCGLVWGAAVYAVSAALSLLLLPAKGCAVLYALVLGHYGVLKSLIERIGKLPLEWICKVALFAALLSALFFAFRWALVLPERFAALALPVLLVGGVAVYVVYDLLFTRLIGLYLTRVQPKLGRLFHT